MLLCDVRCGYVVVPFCGIAWPSDTCFYMYITFSKVCEGSGERTLLLKCSQAAEGWILFFYPFC